MPDAPVANPPAVPPAAPPPGEPPKPAVPPDFEQRMAEMDKKYESAVKEMNERQREAAELRQKYDAMELTASQYQAQLSTLQQKPDPYVQAEQHISDLVAQGEYGKANELSLKMQNQKALEAVQAVAITSLNNTVAQIDLNPAYDEETKRVLKQEIYVDGDPRKGLRNDRFNTLLQIAVTPGGVQELVRTAEERALGRKARSGELEKTWEQKRQAMEKKKDEDLKAQQSLTNPGGGPPVPATEDEIRAQQKALKEAILKATSPP